MRNYPVIKQHLKKPDFILPHKTVTQKFADNEEVFTLDENDGF